MSVPPLRERARYGGRKVPVELPADLLGSDTEPRVSLHHLPADPARDGVLLVGIIAVGPNHGNDALAQGCGNQDGSSGCENGTRHDQGPPALPQEVEDTDRHTQQENGARHAERDRGPQQRE
jgi:hypothetical protein